MNAPRRVVVCGSRDWTDRATIREWIDKLPGAMFGHGGCRGLDELFGQEAEAREHLVTVYAADWIGHGKAAGPMRNRKMLDDFRPALVLAFTDKLTRDGRLSGTGDCVVAANERGIRCTVIPSRRS